MQRPRASSSHLKSDRVVVSTTSIVSVTIETPGHAGTYASFCAVLSHTTKQASNSWTGPGGREARFGRRSSGSFGGIDFPKSESLQNSASYRSFSVQSLIEASAFEAMASGKGALISLALNRHFQKLNNFIIIKYEQVTA
jgi:hypothetical protein